MQACVWRAQKTYNLGTYANKAQKLFIENSVKEKVPVSRGKSREYWDEAVASALELAIVEAKNEFGDKFERKLPRDAAPNRKTSDIVGVSHDPRSGCWRARICFKNNGFDMGNSYKTEEDAAAAMAIAKKEFFAADFKNSNPSDKEILERAALAKFKAQESVMDNIHDGKSWVCLCGRKHSGERKKCQIYDGCSRAEFMEGRAEGCGRWRGGQVPLNLKRKRKKAEPIDMSEKVTVIVPARRKILTVLSSYGGKFGMTAKDIKNKIREDYKDERIVESLIDAKLDALVEENALTMVDDLYLLVEPAPSLVHPSLLITAPVVAKKEETSVVQI